MFSRAKEANPVKFNETMTEYLERIHAIADPRPCLHFYEITPGGILACIRCKQPHPADPSPAD